MKDTERLAVAVAMEKAIKRMTDGKDPDSVRARVDARLHELYEDEGADRLRLVVNGTEVGALSRRKGSVRETATVTVTDYDALMEWLRGNPPAMVRVFDSAAKALAKEVEASGEVPDGCVATVERVERPASTAVYKCEPEDVAAALGDGLQDAVAGLLDG